MESFTSTFGFSNDFVKESFVLGLGPYSTQNFKISRIKIISLIYSSFSLFIIVVMKVNVVDIYQKFHYLRNQIY